MKKAIAVLSILCALEASAQTSAPPAATATAETPLWSDSFVDSIGVNTHITYTDTQYANFPQVYALLKNSGIRHVRDGYISTGTWGTNNTTAAGAGYYRDHQALAAAGIGCDYVVGYASVNNTGGTQTTASDLETFASLVGDMDTLEPANECDSGNNCGGGSGSGSSAAYVQFLDTQLPILKTAGAALSVPVLSPAFVAAQGSVDIGSSVANDVTYGNIHEYFGGRNPEISGWGSTNSNGHGYGSMGWWQDNNSTVASGKANYITETGYLTAPQMAVPYQIPESIQTAYQIRDWFEAFASGIKRTYAYEFLDEADSPMYGLIRSDYSPRPIYMALRNIISLLSDKQSTAPTLSALTYSVAIPGNSSNASLQHVLLERSDGTYYLALWQPANLYTVATNTAITSNIGPTVATLTVSGGPTIHKIYTLQSNGSMVEQSASSTTSAVLSIPSTMMLVRIK